MTSKVLIALMTLWIGTAARADETVPPMPDFPYVHTVVPNEVTGSATESLSAARSVIYRWQAWKAKYVGAPPAFSDWVNARNGLIAVRGSDPEFADAKRLALALDTFGNDLANDEIRNEGKAADNDVAGRKAFAVSYERELLRKWMDVTISTEGNKASTLRIKYVLMSKPLVFNMSQDGGLMDRYRERGFKKLVLTDGYNKSWMLDLRPAAKR
jgi:hypothetical protein